MPGKHQYYILSDLHLEFRQGKEKAFWSEFPDHPDVRTCIVAGDFTSFGMPDGVVWSHFRELCRRFDKVIYVPGNHEYYGTDCLAIERRLRLLAHDFHPILTILKAGMILVHQGQRFLGDTMWFPDRPEVHMYRRMINDYHQIKNLFPWAFTQSGLFLDFLRRECQPNDIVITHHVPTEVDTSSRWKLSPTQPYFVNHDAERYIDKAGSVKPKAWIYGHTHDKHHYSHMFTEFICNPLGYPSENGPDVATSAGQVIYEL